MWNVKKSHISAMATVIKKFMLVALLKKPLGLIYEIQTQPWTFSQRYFKFKEHSINGYLSK